MMTGHVFIATSLDGFIARPDGSLDWLLASDPQKLDYNYDAFISRMDGIVIGRRSFEALIGEPWIYSKPVVVMSKSLADADIPTELRNRVRLSAEAPLTLFKRLSSEGWRRAYVDGGSVIRSFLAEHLIEDMIITSAPVLIGSGRPLFGPVAQDLRLVHEGTEVFSSGLVQSRYKVARAT